MMQNSDPHTHYISRRLTRLDKEGTVQEVDEEQLLVRSPPIVILGEPGMGKTALLMHMADLQPNWQFIRAAKLVRNPSSVRFSEPERILIIDALDEVAALQEGDPLHNVLKALAELDHPSFILSCRAADWRSVLAKFDIAEDYGTEPEEWTLELITREEALEFLKDGDFNEESANSLIQQLENKNLAELYGNPLTLNLLASLASTQNFSLPKTRAELFAQATDVLRRETNSRHERTDLAQLTKENALDASGAIMATFLLTGKDTISLGNVLDDRNGILFIADVAELPGGNHAEAMLHSRLFRAAGSGDCHFIPIHRTIAEYLGARWLAKQIEGNSQATARLFALMTADGLVPASLRGLHAWLAQWSNSLAKTVIRNDPYGLLRYGNADNLTKSQGIALLSALQLLVKDDPYFRAGDWSSYTAKGLTQKALTDAMRTAITNQNTGYQLSSLLLESIRNTAMATTLLVDLENILRDTTRTYVERIHAGEALASSRDFKNWPELIYDLCHLKDRVSPRLALNLIREVGTKTFSENLIAEAILAELGLMEDTESGRSITGGTLYSLEQTIPDEFLVLVLDHLVDGVKKHVDGEGTSLDEWEVRSELARFSRELIIRQLKLGVDDPIRLWRWLDTLDNMDDYNRNGRKEIDNFLNSNSPIRQAIQTHVFFSDEITTSKLRSLYWGRQHSLGLQLQTEDIIIHLEELVKRNDRADRYREAWRILVSASRTQKGIPDKIQTIAERFAIGDKELIAYLSPDPSPAQLEYLEQEREWEAERKQDERDRTERAKKQRANFTAHEKEMRAGDLRWIFGPAQAYLGRFSDVDKEKSPPDRIGDWLGSELQSAALVGFEATLFRDDLPTAEEVAKSYAEGKVWHYIYPIIVALAERWRNQSGFADVPMDVVFAGRMGVTGNLIGHSGGFDGFEDELDEYLRSRPNIFETYLRKWFEPHLAANRQHIHDLYKLARDVKYRPLSTKLSAEWLKQFPNLSYETEIELVQCLITAPIAECDSAKSALISLAEERLKRDDITIERQRLWQSVCFLVAFDCKENIASTNENVHPELLWNVRSIIRGDRGEEKVSLPVSAKQFAWVIESFRKFWPQENRHVGSSTGDTNSWDASEFLEGMIHRLANETSDEAMMLLAALIDATNDGYTEQLRAASATQRRARMEASYQLPTLNQLSDALNNEPPNTAVEVQAIVLDAFDDLQKKIRGNATDTVNLFYSDNGKPKTENECRSLLLDLLDPLPFGIQTSPEEAMPNNSRADIAFRLGAIKVPLEAKGQWHKDVWVAIDTQLKRLYTKDYQSDGRGIYLVFWFGRNAPPGKRLKLPPKPLRPPESALQMQVMLEQQMQKGTRDTITVYVLDLSNKVSK